MSDNATFAAFIEALNNHTKALNAFVAATGKSGGAEKATGSTKASGKAAEKPAAAKKAGKITLEKLTETFGAYLSVKDKDEKKERAGHVKTISEHFGVERISLLDESDYAKAISDLKTFEDGGDPYADEDGEEDEDGDGESMI